MTHQNLFDRLRSLFGTDSTGPVDEDDGPDHRPIAGTERVESDYSHVAEYSFERTVELIHFAQGGTLVVEYDQTDHTDQSITFRSFTDLVSAGTGNGPSATTGVEYKNVVSTVNRMAIAHREEIGTIEVSVARPVKLLERYQQVVNMDELPDRVLTEDGVPIQDHVAANEDDDGFSKPWGANGFEKHEGQVVWRRHYAFDEFTAPVRVEQDKTMGEVLQNAVQGGASNMRAVSADGSIMMPDNEIGDGGDVMEVQALPADER